MTIYKNIRLERKGKVTILKIIRSPLKPPLDPKKTLSLFQNYTNLCYCMVKIFFTLEFQVLLP